MDWSLIIFVAVILLFAWRGFRSGFVRSLGRVLAVIAGYAAAILFGGRLAAWIELQFALQGVIAFGAASLMLFLAAGLGVMSIFALLRRHLFRDDDISTASAVGGSLVGALVGGLLAIAVVWSFAFVRDMNSPVVAETSAPAASSGVEALANRLAGGAVSAALEAGSMEPEVSRLSGVLAAAPAKVMQRVQRIMASPEFLALMQDPRNRKVLDSGRPELVQRLPAFRALAANPDLQALVEMAEFDDGTDVDAELARQLTATWGRARRVESDPRVQAILADPEFRGALDSGNPVALLTNSQLLELADIVFADEPADGMPGQASSGGPADGPAAEPTEIYQWTDSSGRIHFSDQEPAD